MSASTTQGIHCRCSTTLGELQAQLGVSTVLECDAQGHVETRAVALSNPEDRLHTGRTYIRSSYHRARVGSLDAAGALKRDANGKRPIVFSGRVAVTEFELPSPSAADASFLIRPAATDGPQEEQQGQPNLHASVRPDDTAVEYEFNGRRRIASWGDIELLMQRDFSAEVAAEVQNGDNIMQKARRLIDEFDRVTSTLAVV